MPAEIGWDGSTIKMIIVALIRRGERAQFHRADW
jgi:hypothetical protein